MEQHPYKFPLREHLKSKTIIEKVYAEGASVTAFPLRAVFIAVPGEQQLPTASILISVAKRRFRHAVDRNLMKRRIREAYRLNKIPFIEALDAKEKKVAVAILYIDNKPAGTDYLKHKMKKLLNNILEK